MNIESKEINNSIEEKLMSPELKGITIEDIKPEIPELDGTVIILQRNAKDNRNPESSLEMGALVPEAAEQAKLHAKEFFSQIFRTIDPEERKTIDIWVIAADTKLDTPIQGAKSDHKRAVETADQVMSGIKEAMSEFSISDNQLLNKTGKPIELSNGKLKDLHMLEDSPEFVEFLKNKYGTDKNFWIAYENDDEKEIREQMSAEGPDDIANRIENYLKVVANAMESYHKYHPGRRIIAWIDSHYDTISPFVKLRVADMEKTDYLPVDNGAGIVINLSKDQKATTEIQGNKYILNLEKTKETL